MTRKLQVSLILLFCATVTSVAFSEPNIAILWEKDIARANRKIKPYTIKIDEDKDIIRVVGVSYIYAREESPRIQNPELPS
ncbi:MAG TPA: hypothetical protein VMX13_01560 [Sedimentisphaerales bacterium]|nr:hypothetical protein [Sedimentisphaerales bacterium]